MWRDALIASLALATIAISLWSLWAKNHGAPQGILNKAGIVVQLLILAGIITAHPPVEFMTWMQIAMAFTVGLIIAGAYLNPHKDQK